MAKFYYAVKNGRNPGIYNTWSECEQEVKGFENARYKKFKSYEEARDFIGGDNNQTMNLMEVNSKENSLLDIENIKEDEVIAYVDGSFSLDEKAYSYGMVGFS